MSYNGVGLETARGSGTNGYVQKNFAAVKYKKDSTPYRSEDDQVKMDIALSRKPNDDILEHARKRNVELKCIELQDKMEAQGYDVIYKIVIVIYTSYAVIFSLKFFYSSQ